MIPWKFNTEMKWITHGLDGLNVKMDFCFFFPQSFSVFSDRGDCIGTK